MSRKNTRPRIVLIDDEHEQIEEFDRLLSLALKYEDVDIVKWEPTEADGDPDDKLAELAPNGTVMVVADYDLTRKGMRGFQGSAVKSWCQRKLIPVGDFSRGRPTAIPREPNLFGMNIPVETTSSAVSYVVGAYHGFTSIRAAISGFDLDNGSISAITANVLRRKGYEAVLSLYFSRLASSNTAIRDRLRQLASKPGEHDRADILDVLAYVIGHVLLNLVLAFPGPILSREALAAYLAVSEVEAKEVLEVANVPAYEGPFAEIQPFVWREDVDEALVAFVAASDEEPPEDTEHYNRFAVKTVLRRPLSRHGCKRVDCGGERGGYWCPFTGKIVCGREDCSDASTAWVPDGADLCRVEADFFEEFAPLLGL